MIQRADTEGGLCMITLINDEDSFFLMMLSNILVFTDKCLFETASDSHVSCFFLNAEAFLLAL